MEQDLHPQNFAEQYYINRDWLTALGPLTTQNVMDYFSSSMFWDKSTNNQNLRMQTQFTGIPLAYADEAEQLKRFTGMEFAVVHAQPPLWIIHKRDRLSPDEVKPMVAYFVINERIYQAPNVYEVISNRLYTAVNSLQKSLEILRDRRPKFTSRTGFVWPIIEPPSASARDDKKEKEIREDGISGPSSSQKQQQQRQQNNILLLNAMRTTAAHSQSNAAPPWEIQAKSTADSVPPLSAITRGTTPSVAGGVSTAPTPAPIASEAVSQPRKASFTGNAMDTADNVGKPGVPGAGKKKRKRLSMAQGTAPGPVAD